MRKLTVVPLALAAVLLALALGSIVKADNWDKKTVVTFNQDVEIPGQVLPAGTYVFKLLRSNSDRTVVQVTGTDEGYPPAVVSWFFAGSDDGRDFVYSGYSNTRIVDSQAQSQSQQ
jgi:hypothetical protein